MSPDPREMFPDPREMSPYPREMSPHPREMTPHPREMTADPYKTSADLQMSWIERTTLPQGNTRKGWILGKSPERCHPAR